jgi:hypothetical protein
MEYVRFWNGNAHAAIDQYGDHLLWEDLNGNPVYTGQNKAEYMKSLNQNPMGWFAYPFVFPLAMMLGCL